VLGIDNLIFIAVLGDTLPPRQRNLARKLLEQAIAEILELPEETRCIAAELGGDLESCALCSTCRLGRVRLDLQRPEAIQRPTTWHRNLSY
jgi:hypothetical protein